MPLFPITEIIMNFIIGFITVFQYVGIFLAMAVESASMPLPSEVIMPFAGFIVYQGKMNFFLVSIVGALGCVFGSAVSFWVGRYLGRPFIEKYGRYILIGRHELRTADKFFGKYGDETVFISRLLPIIRTYISLPAGVTKMNFKKFCIYTFAGSLPWTIALTYIGVKLGPRWTEITQYFHILDIFAIIGIIGFIAYYAYKVKKG